MTVSSITLHGGSCPSCLHSHSSNKVQPYSTCLHSAVTQMSTSIYKKYRQIPLHDLIHTTLFHWKTYKVCCVCLFYYSGCTRDHPTGLTYKETDSERLLIWTRWQLLNNKAEEKDTESNLQLKESKSSKDCHRVPEGRVLSLPLFCRDFSVITSLPRKWVI